jgi:transposase InsO family protein
MRDKHPAWGARKIAHCLKRGGQKMPVPSTVHRILCRNDRIKPSENAPPNPGHRFEKEAPNLLWQMDFKGHLALGNGTRCHPLTIVDDHSRYLLCLKACANEQRPTVQEHLTATFRRYGLPEAFYTDNGSPWGDTSGVRWTGLKVWLLKLGVRVIHARPCHPQGRGKNERFHRTLDDEVFAMRPFRTLPEVQRAFDAWRAVGQVHVPCRPAFPRCSTTAARSCVGSPRPDPTSPSREGFGRFPRPSRVSVLPSDHWIATATTESSSPVGRSPPST